MNELTTNINWIAVILGAVVGFGIRQKYLAQSGLKV